MSYDPEYMKTDQKNRHEYKFSSTYGNILGNFVFQNLDNMEAHAGKDADRDVHSICAVILNIIQRGSPSRPDGFLRERLGLTEKDDTFDKVGIISCSDPVWSNTIKGDDDSCNYPAQIFYDNLPHIFPCIRNIKNFVLPEAYIEDILQDGRFRYQQVDFYIPCIRTVIEIDGSTHEDCFQKSKDIRRDRALERFHNKCFRISTAQARSGRIDEEIIRYINEKFEMRRDKISYSNDIDPLFKNRIRLDVIIRLQVLILKCLQKNILSVKDCKWNIFINSDDIMDVRELFMIAYEDTMRWFHSIASLLKYDADTPKIVFKDNNDKSAADLCLDISAFDRYTDSNLKSPDTVFIRNDYYSDYDHYRLESGDPLQYRIDMVNNSAQRKALLYLFRNIFGFDSFRDGQESIIENVLNRHDTIGILPTGTGKSICYQIAAMLQPGICIVVAPLIALIRDQIRGMNDKGIIRVDNISSIKDGKSKQETLRALAAGKLQFVIVSPERFQNREFIARLNFINSRIPVITAVIDEVHCLSEWGHDFRVSYLTLIKTLRKYCAGAKMLGLTATASQAVLEDLKSEFGITGIDVKALGSMTRSELVFRRVRCTSEKAYTCPEEIIKRIIKEINADEKLDLLDGTNCKEGEYHNLGVIFTATRKTFKKETRPGCIDLCRDLREEFKTSDIETYHGSLSSTQRDEIQQRFMENRIPLLISTKAFGMGIDKDNIRYTIHYGLPQSIEGFYQEAGRAGRASDKSLKSYCYIVYVPERCSEQDIELILSADTGIEERKALSDRYLTNDLATIMYLWNSNKIKRQQEYNEIRHVLMDLDDGIRSFEFDDNVPYNESFEVRRTDGNGRRTERIWGSRILENEEKKNEVYKPSRSLFDVVYRKEKLEQILYKLSVVGITGNWTVKYYNSSGGSIDVEMLDYDEQSIRENLLKHIYKHDIQFTLDDKHGKYKIFSDIMDSEEKPIVAYINILIEWTNQFVVNQRLQSTRNMWEFCNSEEGDEEFTAMLDSYFRFSEITVAYDAIVYAPLEYSKWFDIMFSLDDNGDRRSIDIEEAQNRLSSLQRYLESYRNNTGLNYVAAMLRLKCGRFRDTEGKYRLRDALETIRSMDERSQDDILERTLELAAGFKLNDKDDLSRMICEYYPDKVNHIFERLHDRYSLSKGIGPYIDKLKRLKENKIKWII